jgi:serine/threonine protein kinase
MPRDLRRKDQIAKLFTIEEPIDVPAGSRARVYAAHDIKNDRNVAFKVLRVEHLEQPEEKRRIQYEAFTREAEILLSFQDDSRVMEMYEMGYIWDERDGDGTVYEAESVGLNLTDYQDLQHKAIALGWRPYLILKRYPPEHSLHHLVVHNPRRARLPMIEAIDLTLQLTDLIMEVHRRGIIYWDAKPAHAYWDSENLVLIDWNLSFPLTEENVRRLRGTEESLKQKDLVILGRQFIYPAFTGLDFQGDVSSSAGTLSEQTVAEKFGYDYKGDVPLYGCEHFDAPVRNFLGRVVQSDQYINALDLRRDLEDCAVKLGWSFEHKEADPRAAQALAHKRKALLYLREAQRAMIEAIDEIDQSHALQGGMDTDHLVEQVEKLYKSSFLP